MKFWRLKQKDIDTSIIYFDISMKYICVEVYGIMIGVDF